MGDRDAEQLGKHEADFEFGVRFRCGIMEDRGNQILLNRRCKYETVNVIRSGGRDAWGYEMYGVWGIYPRTADSAGKNWWDQASAIPSIEQIPLGGSSSVDDRHEVRVGARDRGNQITHKGALRSLRCPQRLLGTE